MNRHPIKFTDAEVANEAFYSFIISLYPNIAKHTLEKRSECLPFLTLGNTMLMDFTKHDDIAEIESDYFTAEEDQVFSTKFISAKNFTLCVPVEDHEAEVLSNEVIRDFKGLLFDVTIDQSLSEGERALRQAVIGRVLRLTVAPWMKVQVVRKDHKCYYFRINYAQDMGPYKAALDQIFGDTEIEQEFHVKYYF